MTQTDAFIRYLNWMCALLAQKCGKSDAHKLFYKYKVFFFSSMTKENKLYSNVKTYYTNLPGICSNPVDQTIFIKVCLMRECNTLETWF